VRRRKEKIKVQHSLVEGLKDVLEEIASWDCVESIIPGEIKSKGGVRKGGKFLSLKYRTPTGFKLIWKKGAVSQEVFVVVKKGQDKEFLKNFQEFLKEIEKGRK